MGWGADYFARRQALFLIAGALVFLICYTFPIEKLRSWTGLLAILSLLLLATPFIPGLGVEINGGRRWINLYFANFQPSELWKPVSILYVANILDRRSEAVRASAGEAVFPFIMIALGVVLVFMQNDFSTAMLALTAALAVFWLAGVPFKFFLMVLVPALLAAVLMVASSEYRLTRVLGYIIPEYDPHGMNYQVQNSLRAIMSGGLFGKGLGLGTRKLGTIPEIESDFVFAGFAEETGYLGVLAVTACWGFMVVTTLKALRGKNGFRYLLPMGLLFLLCIQYLVNLGVVSGFLPATGIALPFFSAGGSSLLSTALAGGLIANSLNDKGFMPVPAFDAHARLEGGGNG